MGSHILKISPFTHSRTLIVNPTSTLLRTPIHNIPKPRFIHSSINNPIRYNSNLSSGFCGSAQIERKRSFRSGIIAMAVQKSDEEWRTVLSPEQFRILRQKGTEYPGTGQYDKFYEDGVYQCAGCGTPLYKSTTKFNSGCGWPAFYEGLPGAIKQTPDADGRRIEITCAACGGHLGHVFKGEGFRTPTDERHCVNSISLKFTPAN
ncbi:hypothetical protein BUALT_Bualt19G0099200 [Buddleja alternifolia]|uniref:Peptide-methionine (R)-S-oxide reductase n=1 Tax=Buddleja alternifolia TaxID=168488 RepID=A0AAV6WB38_9LAMI|nr:hypothetical protein BUALT_Bualt19G0099200 [Buddleja alternifolia]